MNDNTVFKANAGAKQDQTTINPFFSSAEGGVPRRRLLLITYYFPPAPDVGGLRWQQMARGLADRGWAVDVVAGDLEKVSNPDSDRLATLPPGTRVFSVPARTSAPERVPLALLLRIRSLLAFSRSETRRAPTQSGGSARERPAPVRAYLAWLFFMHDRAWAKRAARLATSLARLSHYDAVVSSGPPHLAHEAARLVSRRSALPLIIDLRDLWSLVERIPERINSAVWWVLARRYERRAMRDASLVLVNTEVSRSVMSKAYPEQAPRIHVIRNGSDGEPMLQETPDSRFTIGFAGSIYIDRNPRLLFRAVSRLVAERQLTPEQFAIEFVGHVDRFADVPTMQIAAEEGVADHVRVGGFLSRAETLAFLARSTMLLSLPQDSNSAIPAKIYEYVQFPAWLLVLAESNSASAQVLRGTTADVVGPDDLDAITDVLRRRFDQFARGERPLPVNTDRRFDRALQTGKLADLLDGLS